jgi:hypothetical protein
MDSSRIKGNVMRRGGLSALLLAVAVVPACKNGTVGGDGLPYVGAADGDGSALNGTVDGSHQPTVLDERVSSYTDALRTASLKLTDRLPTLKSIKALQAASDQRAEYRKAVDAMFESAAFNQRMIRWSRDTLRQGGGDLDSAPVFLARIIVEGRALGELFTAPANNCPSYDGMTNTFKDATCNNGAPVQAGVLTNPGSMKQFYSSMAFRRVRWVQEIFACQKFPAEYRKEPVPMGAGQYTSPWTFESVSKSPVDFQDTKAAVCANCHTSMNHIAPLFGNFDKDGMWKATVQVLTPTAPDPQPTKLSHWLSDGEITSWRHEKPVKDLAELGKAMATDPAVTACIAARLWNFTMSKEDIVSDMATVPEKVVRPYIDQLSAGGSIKETLKAMFKSDDFTKF